MLDKIMEKFEDCDTVLEYVGAIVVTLIIIALALGIAFGFYTLVVYVFSLAFGFAFKWIYVPALWLSVVVLRKIFGSNRNAD